VRMFNTKISAELAAMIDRAVEVSGAKSRSEWAREALEAAARIEIARAELVRARAAQAARRQATLGRRVLVGGACTHPPTAKRQTVTREFCSICGKTLKSLVG
jgi:Arc/MetJ-type ribon-helix-helix transcriptional regulator